MTTANDQIVPVEIGQIGLHWECPNCNEQNDELFKRNFDFNEKPELRCRKCDIIIVSEGKILWKIK